MDGKTVWVSKATHARLKRVAKKTGMKSGALADAIIASWLSGDAFFLPRGERSGKAKAEASGRAA